MDRLIDQLQRLVKGTDIEIVSVEGNEVIYLLPYDNSDKSVFLEGVTDEEMIANFIEHINSRLDSMIDHLKDCKLHNPGNVGKYTTQQVFCG
jgi:hypothetical protein